MTATAYLNHGRWVVDCPSLNCAGALKLWSGQTPVACNCRDIDFCQHGPLCATVFNVVWPADRETIEATVADRPILNRNWLPDESLDLLLEENMAHGLDRS